MSIDSSEDGVVVYPLPPPVATGPGLDRPLHAPHQVAFYIEGGYILVMITGHYYGCVQGYLFKSCSGLHIPVWSGVHT